MADEKAGQFDPDEHKAGEVVEHLEGASEQEKAAVVAQELQRDKPRSTVIKAAGLDPNKRYDASGRELMAHEVSPAKKSDSEEG